MKAAKTRWSSSNCYTFEVLQGDAWHLQVHFFTSHVQVSRLRPNLPTRSEVGNTSLQPSILPILSWEIACQHHLDH